MEARDVAALVALVVVDEELRVPQSDVFVPTIDADDIGDGDFRRDLDTVRVVRLAGDQSGFMRVVKPADEPSADVVDVDGHALLSMSQRRNQQGAGGDEGDGQTLLHCERPFR